MMRKMNEVNRVIKRIFILLITGIFLSFPGISFSKESIANQILKTMAEDEELEALTGCATYLYPMAECLIVKKNDEFNTRTLIIFNRTDDGHIQKVFQYESEYSAPSLIETIDANTIMVVWETGSAKAFTFFRTIGKTFKLVLEEGGRNRPEAVDLSGDGDSKILISKNEDGPLKTAIYQFKKDKFIKIKEVPYKDRFSALK